MSNNYEDGGDYFDLDDIMLNNDEDGGIYFNPEDEELINKHLLLKLKTYLKSKSKDEDCEDSKSKDEDCEDSKSKDEDCEDSKPESEEEDYDDFIEMKNVYEKEPWLLDHINNPLFRKNEWFYFVTRTQVSVKNIGRGRNSKRRITDTGSWKANAKQDIKDEKTKKIIGKKQTLKFTKSDNDKKKQKTGDNTSVVVVPGSNSSWIMYEYSLPDEHTFQELVLCKIRKIRKSKDDDEAMEEVTHNVEEEGDLSDNFARTGLDDPQQATIYPLAQTSDPHPARFGDKSLPIEVHDDEDEKLMNQELDEHLFDVETQEA
ncbi:unnamed protein product [Eruca vesicaria subsp. sativa]|uniref:NAC domain-containing protein n=1 Tax=Eruca vesicaria subsp. sativa TaxID=29727 RepID=A0ABC8KZT9_ERUVS|nr:unnamed protein product [Eruca vesicaria subsp. sativa]